MLLSINYLFIVENDLIQLPKKYAINIHGSLLPKYRGRTPHVWAIINGEKETGVTAHLMEAKVDEGAIVHQIRIPILEQDTGGNILEKYEEVYPQLIEKVLKDIKNNCINLIPQDESKATYFGKRTPEDGRINWHWSRERIRNWIRAQAKPYPGAFTYFEENQQRLVIHKAQFSERGFHYQMENGRILETGDDHMVIKTSNGSLRIFEMEHYNKDLVKQGIVLL